ncbi:hemerythrin domain-containing protein [Nocardioides sp. GXQ0305]|uniref:hemerythrin domain-containing protein n=1 Tax=Nocardioides sp. GXQ0305 TaxID=3423912 RepID=UPI003D7D6405
MAIDTRMNGVIHAALRRDLERIAMLVERPDDLSGERLRAIGGHAVWLMGLLHEHHTTEDERLFPVMRANNPDIGLLLDTMLAEHGAIAAAVTALEEAGRRAESGDPGAAEALQDAVVGLRRVLDPHLEHEERSLSPLVPDSMTDEQWSVFEKSNVEGKKPPELAFQGHWMLDNLDPSGAAVVKKQVPAVPRFVMLTFLGGPYRKRREACWGGTPAADVRAVPLIPG